MQALNQLKYGEVNKLGYLPAEKKSHFRFAPQADIEDWPFANPETGKPYWPGRVQENWLVPAAE